MSNNCRNSNIRFRSVSGFVKIGPGARITLIVCGLFIAACIYWGVTTFNTLQKPLLDMGDGEGKYKGLIATAGYRDLFMKDVLVFDLKKVPLDLDSTAPYEYFLQYIVALENQGIVFSKVEIRYKGKTKYVLDGDAVHNLAALSITLKPLEIALLFPPMLKKADGKQAFTIPYGDEQWVEQKKINNFKTFLEDWYLKDLGTEISKKGKPKEVKTTDKPGKSTESKTPDAAPSAAPAPSSAPVIEDITEIPDETPGKLPLNGSPAPEEKSPSKEVSPVEPDTL
ncbi:MAG: hypothetical protein LWY06_08270 [Firmicutes bacterium]|nr:hypothetical protein [Bacillota bacterium]